MTEPEKTDKQVGQARELTERAKNFLAAIVASSDDAIVSKDLNGIISTWNDGARRIFGWEAEEIVGRSILTLIPPELHAEEDYILASIRSGKRIEHFETTRMRKNGERFPVAVTISPIRDDNGAVIGASKIARDISERRRGEENRARLAAIVESAADAMMSMDLDGKITSWNRGAERLFGYREEEMIGQAMERLIPEHLRQEAEEVERKLAAGERIEHYETSRVTKAGELREVSISLSPIRNERGEVTGASLVERDVSDRKKVERLAIEAEKIAATGRMAAAFAHEINSPLSAVLNAIYLARRPGRSAEDVQRHLDLAESEIERVSHIARQTLGFYRNASVARAVAMRELIDSVLGVFRSRLVASKVTVETDYQAMRAVKVQTGEAIQVLSNVIGNAIDAMAGGGQLTVATRAARGGGVQVVIRDTGCGISRENLERVFEPFFTTKGEKGTGIGLWVSRQLMERHQGHISMTSSTEAGASGTAVRLDFGGEGEGGPA